MGFLDSDETAEEETADIATVSVRGDGGVVVMVGRWKARVGVGA